MGCGGERSDANQSGAIKVNTPADITNESHDDYNKNVNGLISHTTLARWVNDWENEKPAGIKGKLVILQQSKGDAGFEFIKPNNKNVFTYLESGWREPRSNGVITIGSHNGSTIATPNFHPELPGGQGGIVLSGPRIDSLLRKYGIDVQNDMIVCAAGHATATNGGAYMNQGRCWYTLSYWGVSQKNLAVLNGLNSYIGHSDNLGQSFFTSSTLAGSSHPSPIINKQVSSVKDLKVDNTALYASLEDLINVLPLADKADATDGVLLWDARNLPQFSAGKAKWNGAETNAVEVTEHKYSGFQNAAPRQSHPRGALHLEYSNVLNMETGIYHNKDVLWNILKGGKSPKGERFVEGGLNESYDALNEEIGVYHKGDTVYHFCETSARAGTALITTAVILGIPSRMYDSGIIEWNSLTSGTKDLNGNTILPNGSPWDTELLSAPVGVYSKVADLSVTHVLSATGVSAADPRSPEGWAAHINLKKPDADPVTAEDVIENSLATPLITNPYAEHTQEIPNADRAYKQPVVEAPSTGGSSGGSSGGSGAGSALPGNPCGG